MAADAPGGDKPVQLEGVSITGSRIRRIEAEGPTPVEVITAQRITEQGFNNVQQLFDNLSLNVGGSLARNQSFGFTPGASGVDLRGFGVGRTLILVDGRRLPVYPIAAGGTDNFVDLSSIPTSIVERVEILTTGGSAIYGSDAISGVVNIITKKRLNGFEGSARVGGTEHGGYSNERFELSYGFSTEKDSLIISGQFFHNDPLNASQREYSKLDTAPGTGIIGRYSSYGASFLDFGNGTVTPTADCSDSSPIGKGLVVRALPNPFGLAGTTCGFNRAAFRELFPGSDQTSVFAKFEHKFDFATAYVNALYNDTNTVTNQEPFPYYSPLIPAGAPNNPGGAGGGSGYFYRRMIEFGGRGDNTDNLTTGLLAGLKGSFGDYDWDVGLSRNQVRANDTHPSIIKSALDKFVCGGTIVGGACDYSGGTTTGLNLLDPIPQSVIDQSSYLRSKHAVSQNTTIDATINGPIPGLKLPGGAIQFSAYAAFQREYYSDLNDFITSSGQGTDGSVDAHGNRSHSSYALEFDFPITSQLTFNTAGRYDIYNTSSGESFTAQGALQYRPIKEVLLRSSIGSTFRAPDLQRLYGGQTSGFEDAIDSPACLAAGGTVGDPTSPTVCTDPVQAIPVVSTGNPNLKSEKGTNYSFGFVVEPVKRMTFSVDYFYIQLRNAVQSPTAQYILNQCAENGVLCDKITRDGSGSLNRGLIVEDPLNTAGQKQKGVDGKLTYELKVDEIGKFELTTTATYLFSSRYQINADSPDTQQLGYASVPRYRLNSLLDWSLGPFGADITYLYVPHIPGSNASNPATHDQYLEAFDQINLQVRYKVGKWGTVRAGVNNVLDAHPPFDRTDDNNQFTSGVALAFSNALGREGFLQYEFKF